MGADIDTDLWRAFVAVADHGGFSRAARLLNRTQSAVSMQIKRLEDSARVRLLDRGGGRVRVTPEGEALLGYARRILALNDEALERLAGDRLAGTVRLGAMDDYATAVMPAVLARFAAAHPGVRIEVETGLTGAMLPRLGADFDLVLAMHPAGGGRGEVLRREAAVWAAAPDGAAAARDPLPLALYPQGCLFRRWALAALDSAGRRWHVAYVSPSLGAVAAAVAAGLAVTVCKAGTLPPPLRRLGPERGLPPLPTAEIALHRAPGELPWAAARLGEFIAASLRDDRP